MESMPEAAVRVLVVGDAGGEAIRVTRYLQFEGHEVDLVADAKTAGNHVEALAPQLMVLLPEEARGETARLCRKLRETLPEGAMPILLVAPGRDDPCRLVHREYEADDLLVGPLSRAALVARVDRLLAQSRRLGELLASRQGLEDELRALRSNEGSRNDLVNMLLHDLKNPLCAIQLCVDMLQGGQGSLDLGQTTLNEISDYTKDLGTLLHNILDVVRADQAGLSPQLAPLSLAGLAAVSLRYFRIRARREKKVIRLHIPDDLPDVMGDMNLVSRVLENLLDNALRVSPEGSEVTVEARSREDGWLELDVADRGPGVPEHLREAVFEKFRSEAPARTGGRRNHGLGLTLCKMVVESHGGRIGIHSRPGGGAVFRIELPRAGPKGPVAEVAGEALSARA